MPGLLIIAHAPLASALCAVARHVYPDCSTNLAAFDVLPDAPLEQIEAQAATLLGQTGPIWHFQYTRIYALPKGYLAAGHDIRAGIKVSYADDLVHVADSFDNDGVHEFILDELRFRGLLDAEHARAH